MCGMLNWLLVPHELLHVVGYRLVGRRCVYRWGDDHVSVLGSPHWFGRLFPFGVSLALWLITLILTGVAYAAALQAHVFPSDHWTAEALPTVFWGVCSVITGIHVGLSYYDVQKTVCHLRQIVKQPATDPPQ